MILSDTTIREEIRKDRLNIDPFVFENIQSASIDLRLGKGFKEVDYTRIGCISLDEKIPYNDIEGDRIIIPPHHFVLGTTLESVTLPDNICGKVEGRSSIGRIGLFIQNAGWIDPGFEGQITLEFYNANNISVEIISGRRICQLVLSYTDRPVENPYKGKYQGQRGVVGSRIDEDVDEN